MPHKKTKHDLCVCQDPPLPPGWVDPPDKPGLGMLVVRYMPTATPEEHDAAYQNVENLIGVLIRINNRLRDEHHRSN
ncbi:MAG: hypothetical protein JST16_04955 [Bdellovibrionales bacterium]|nr:hypothetical protein [Bdellovibrionales bacterium]